MLNKYKMYKESNDPMKLPHRCYCGKTAYYEFTSYY